MIINLSLEDFLGLPINLNELYLLERIYSQADFSGVKDLEVRRNIGSALTLLEMKGFVDQYNRLTVKAIELIERFKRVEEIMPDKVTDFTEWVKELHTLLQIRMIILCGKKQKVLSNGFSFLCNVHTLEKKLKSIMGRYKITDRERIRRTILSHMDKAKSLGWEYQTIIEYYIEKNGVSKLLTDLDNLEDVSKFKAKEEVIKQESNIVDI